MKRELLELICCPACQQTFELEEKSRREPEVWEGALHCTACQSSYPIKQGLPHLYVDDEKWTTKAVEAEGWVTYHKSLGIYEQSPDSPDLKIPYYPEEPWIRVARSFDMALEILQLTGAETILDLGAGRGWAAKEFTKRGCRAVALDVAPDENVGLGRARALMDHDGVYFDRLIADGENLPFLAQKFDLVFCAAALHHSSNLDLLLKNVRRILKPNGRICAINEPCISIFTEKAKVLKQDAMAELEAGINETRPNLLEYMAALNVADLCLIQAFPAHLYPKSEEQLAEWARSAGALLPRYVPHRIRQYLKQLALFGTRFLLSLKSGSYGAAQQLLAEYPEQTTALKVLLWVGGELFLLAGSSQQTS